MKGPVEIRTERLSLRKPTDEDLEDIYQRYASDDSVGRYLAWPIHTSIDDTRAFLDFSASEWGRWPAGPYLIFLQDGGSLVGGTGLGFESLHDASTGYVIARDSWGNGIATEATVAMQRLAAQLGVKRLSSCCHPDHKVSRHILEKCGFELEQSLCRKLEFPNLSPGRELDVVSYTWTPGRENHP